MNTDTNIITLDVGGRIFKTTRQTLIGGSEYFRDLFEDSHNNNEPLFINRSYEAFEHVLNLLRNPTYKFPDQYLEELKYFGIAYTNSKKNQTNIIKIYFRDGTINYGSRLVLEKYEYFRENIHNNELYILNDKKLFSQIYTFLIDENKFVIEFHQFELIRALKLYKLNTIIDFDIDNRSSQIFTLKFFKQDEGTE